MTGDIERLLVAVDEDIEENTALRYGVNLARILGAELEVIHVVEEALIYPGWGAMVAKTKDDIDKQERRMTSELKKFKKGLKVDIGVRIREGVSPAAEVLNELHEENFDLLVVGSHGTSAVMEFLLGGISSQIIHHAKKPVIVVKKLRDVANILMCTAGSKCSYRAIRFATSIAKAAGADVTVLSISPWKSSEAVNQAWEFVHAGVEILKEHGVAAGEMVRIGKPAEEILAEARKRDFDLIVMGYRGTSAVADMLLGEVASKVMHHSLRPTLIFRE
ncbi:MAG: universal stress protein [Thermoplasmata archaeon]|nr:universal stress protein [Thermoplasmata archaeon]